MLTLHCTTDLGLLISLFICSGDATPPDVILRLNRNYYDNELNDNKNGKRLPPGLLYNHKIIKVKRKNLVQPHRPSHVVVVGGQKVAYRNFRFFLTCCILLKVRVGVIC